MFKLVFAFIPVFMVACSYVTKVHITGFIQGFNPEADYDFKVFENDKVGEGFPDSVEIKGISKEGWFDLDPDSSATSYLILSDSVQFRMKSAGRATVLNTFVPMFKMHRQAIIDDQGTVYYVRWGGRGRYYIDNLRVGNRHPGNGEDGREE